MSSAQRSPDTERTVQMLEAYARATALKATPPLRARVLAVISHERASLARPSNISGLTALAHLIRDVIAPRRMRAFGLALALLALVGAGLALASASGRLQLPWVAPVTAPNPTDAPEFPPAITAGPGLDAEPSEEAEATEAPESEATETEPADDGDEVDQDHGPTPEATQDDRDDGVSPTDDAATPGP